MNHNGIKSFSIYFEYVDLIDILSEEEQAYFYLKTIRYIFYDIEPTNLTKNQKKIWDNLVRPLDKSKKQAFNSLKKDIDTNLHTKQETNLYPNGRPKQDTQSKMSMSNVNCNNVNDLDIYKQVINYLNSKTKSNFKYTTKATQIKIKARLNEGYKLDDFIAVIDKKSADWKNTEFEQYLRPETLFGTKFESYLNQKRKGKPQWMNQQISKENLTKEEEQEMKEMLKDFYEENANG